MYPIATYVDAFQASGMKAAADSLETTTTNFTSLIEESREEIFRIPSLALKLEFEDVCTNYVLGELTKTPELYVSILRSTNIIVMVPQGNPF